MGLLKSAGLTIGYYRSLITVEFTVHQSSDNPVTLILSGKSLFNSTANFAVRNRLTFRKSDELGEFIKLC